MRKIQHRLAARRWRPGAAALFLAAALASPAGYVTTNTPPARLRPAEPEMTGQAAQFAPRRAGADVMASIRLGITTAGLYRVTGGQLAGLGVDLATVAGSSLRLYCQTQEVAVLVSSDGPWTTNDYLLFYGLGLDSVYSITNVYWLGFGGAGLRIPAVNGATNQGGGTVAAYGEAVRYHAHAFMDYTYAPVNDTIDHWFSAFLQKGFDTVCPVDTSGRDTATNATLRLRLWGRNADPVSPDHVVQVRIGTSVVTTVAFDGMTIFEGDVEIPAGLLSTGVTAFVFQPQGTGTADQVYLEQFELHLRRALRAQGDRLRFGLDPGAGPRVMVADGFSSDAILLLDVAAPHAPLRLTNLSMWASGGGFAVAAGTTATNARHYFACTTGAVSQVTDLGKVFWRNLADPGRQADYILICPYALRVPAYELLKHRHLRGATVAVAPAEDIYNEFGYGILGASAIKQFIGYAFHHWAAPPGYVCLAGDGTYDPCGYNALNPPVWLPVKLGPTFELWTAQDNWFATVNGADPLPDVRLGRVTAGTVAAFSSVVAKTRSYETSSLAGPRRATLVTDRNRDGIDFHLTTTNLVSPPLMAAGYSIANADLNIVDTNTARFTIANTVNSGRQLLTFVGHGNKSIWSWLSVWGSNDILSLTNSRYPIVAVFTCNNGFFQDLSSQPEAMSEVFLERANYGAVAVLAPTALSHHPYAEQLAQGFFRVFTNAGARMGDALWGGLLQLYAANTNGSPELQTYMIQGDPMLEIR